MAGSYVDVPSRRMAWDADGSVGLYLAGVSTTVPDGPWSEMTSSHLSHLNDEDPASLGPTIISGGLADWRCVIFPELRDFDGFLNIGLITDSEKLETSPDTTNGIDGTWTSRSTSSSLWVDSAAVSAYRTNILSFAVSSIRAIRWVGRLLGGTNTGHRTTHIYGTIASGETPDRLLWIDETTGLEFTAAKDYGDVPRGSARDIGIRLKNNSGTLTANTIQVTTEDLFGGSASFYTLTTPGGSTFQSTQQIASLGAGATTGLITLRQIVSDAATLGLHAARLYTAISSWT